MPLKRPLSIAMSLTMALAGLGSRLGTAHAGPPRSEASTSAAAPAVDPPVAEPSVMIWPVDTESDVTPVESALADEGHRVVPFGPIADVLITARRQRRQAEQAQLGVVEAGLVAAQERYLSQSWDAMLAELLQLQDDALPVLARPAGCATLWELQFRQGLGYGARRGPEDAAAQTESFAMAFSLDPARRPVGDLYGPDVAAAFIAAVDVASARAERPTTLSVTPPDATVTVDCVATDVSDPVALKPGRHAVVVDAPGFVTHAEIIDVGSGDPVVLILKPEATADPVKRLAMTWSSPRLMPTGPSSRAAIAGVARHAGASRWIVLQPTDAGARAELWQQGRRRSVVERPSADAAALGVLSPSEVRGRRAPAEVGPTTVTPPAASGGRGDATTKPLVRRWWFWTAIAAGVVGTGLGVGLGVGLRQRSPNRLQVVVQ